jgi:hypothetical protein
VRTPEAAPSDAENAWRQRDIVAVHTMRCGIVLESCSECFVSRNHEAQLVLNAYGQGEIRALGRLISVSQRARGPRDRYCLQLEADGNVVISRGAPLLGGGKVWWCSESANTNVVRTTRTLRLNEVGALSVRAESWLPLIRDREDWCTPSGSLHDSVGVWPQVAFRDPHLFE